MINCLSMDYPFITKETFKEYANKIFQKLQRKHDLDVELVICNMSNVADFYNDQAATKAFSKNGSLAVTVHHLMTYAGKDLNDPNTKVVKVKQYIYFPYESIMKIANACDNIPRKIKFCIRQIIKHEYGHAMDANHYVGMSFQDAMQQMNKQFDEHEQFMESLPTPRKITSMAEWLKLGQIETEHNADAYGGINVWARRRLFRLLS